ncbi:MAG: ATP-binding protein [Candidatus Cybelea sp.]|jgi:anti-sigma regulatory factor (Ser/Thr protein kinase)
MRRHLMGASELRLCRPAQTRSVAPIRRALRTFLEALAFDGAALDDITTAAGEALANAAEHAYAQETKHPRRDVELLARFERGELSLEISDGGCFIERSALPGRGFGLRIIRAIAHQMQIETSHGTRIRMLFPGPLLKS